MVVSSIGAPSVIPMEDVIFKMTLWFAMNIP